jgi:hypothetical protein
MRKLLPAMLILSPLATVAAANLLLAWQQWQPTNAQPGSLAYLLAIPSRAKSFPLWELCGSPSFTYRAEDGPSPETYSIQYQTRLSNVALAQNIDDYARSGGCKYTGAPVMPRNGAEIGLEIACGAGSPELQFIFPRHAARPPSCLPVLVTFTEKLL